MSVRVRYSLSIVALAGIWLTMLLCGGGPLDRQIYEALYAGHRPMLAGIARVRPDLEPHLVVVKTSSFPSGHAASSTIFYLTVALVLAGGSRWRFTATAAAIILALLIGISRVMLGVHWPSDVIGGWAFGMLWVLLTLRLSERLFRA